MYTCQQAGLAAVVLDGAPTGGTGDTSVCLVEDHSGSPLTAAVTYGMRQGGRHLHLAPHGSCPTPLGRAVLAIGAGSLAMLHPPPVTTLTSRCLWAPAGTWMNPNNGDPPRCFTYSGTWEADFSCACATPEAPLEWRASTRCLAGADAATGGDWPPVCRHRRAHLPSEPYRAGHVPYRVWNTGDWRCDAPDSSETWFGVGMSPKEFETLCQGEGEAPLVEHCAALRRPSWLPQLAVSTPGWG